MDGSGRKALSVFLSHSSADWETVSSVSKALSDAEYQVWVGQKSIPPGGNYAAVIPDAIKESDILVLWLTKDSLDSPWVQKEVGIALTSKIPVIPVAQQSFQIHGAMAFYLADVQIAVLDELSDIVDVVDQVLHPHGSFTAMPEHSSVPTGIISTYLRSITNHADSSLATITPLVASRTDLYATRQPLPLRTLEEARQRKLESKLSATSLIEVGRRVLVEGPAGSGKSTFIESLCYEIAREGLVHGVRAIPVLIRMATYSPTDLDHLVISAISDELNQRVSLDEWVDASAQKQLIVFLDGLDEYRLGSADGQGEVASCIDQICCDPRVLSLVATRRQGRWDPIPGLERHTIEPLGWDEQLEFLRRYFAYFDLKEDPLLVLRSLAPGLLDLAERPLFLALLVNSLVLECRIPDDPDELYSDYIRAVARSQGDELSGAVERALTSVAFFMVQKSVASLGLEDLLRIIALSVVNGERQIESELVVRAVLETGILRFGSGKVRFQHLTLMDALALREVAAEYSFWPAPAMDQYFLRNRQKIDTMIRCATLSTQDQVMEVGAGIGSVAERIPLTSKLILVELDPDLCHILRYTFADRDDQISIQQRDAIHAIGEEKADIIFSNLPFFLTHEVFTALTIQKPRVAVLSVREGEDLSRWMTDFDIQIIETLEEADFFPRQPFRSTVVRVVPWRKDDHS